MSRGAQKKPARPLLNSGRLQHIYRKYFWFHILRIVPRLHDIPDERSEVVLDVIVRRSWIQSVIFTSSRHPHHRVIALKTVTAMLSPRLQVISAVDVVESVAELSAPSVLHKLLLHLISASPQSLERWYFQIKFTIITAIKNHWFGWDSIILG